MTGRRTDCPEAHEITHSFAAWNSTDEVTRQVILLNLANDCRVFAIPRTIITQGAANEIGDWLKAELKKGSDLYGDLLRNGLLRSGEMLGNSSEWAAYVRYQAHRADGLSQESARLRALEDHYLANAKERPDSSKRVETRKQNQTHFFRWLDYMAKLLVDIYPSFDLASLLAPPKHRSRGKQYVRNS